MIRNLDHLDLASKASIGTFNWIAGNRTGQGHSFKAFPQRFSVLSLGEEAAIVARHIIDCTDAVTIGRFSTVAGHRSQFLTHSIDLKENIQACAPITIGDYCFIGTGVIVLKGSVLPNHSVLGAGAVLINKYNETFSIYAGNPAKKLEQSCERYKYFHRTNGYVF